MKKRERPQSMRVAYTDPQRIHDEIAYMEVRLGEIGYVGDCAYEKAIIRFFEQQVEMRRSWLQAS